MELQLKTCFELIIEENSEATLQSLSPRSS
jgi:hypothetical protein